MAATSVKKTAQKKHWFPIIAGGIFNNAPLGESLVTSPEKLVNRNLRVNMANITGDVREQSTSLLFRVESVKDKTAIAMLYGSEKADSAIKRLVRRNIDRLDTSFMVETKDGNRIRIKPMALTRHSTSGSVLTGLHVALTLAIKREARRNTFEQFSQLILSHKLQSATKRGLSKIYPIKTVEIKAFRLIGEKKTAPAPQHIAAQPSDKDPHPEHKESSSVKPGGK